jgi:CubicO group peptidase (beta-lactamase class C family)
MPPPPFPSEGFSGVVRAGGESWAFGFADRAHEIPNTVDTQFGLASGTKGFTAVVARAVLPLELRARELLGADLPLIDDRVTVEHLLAHTSGIGDYFDEEAHPDAEAYATGVPVSELATTEDYVRVLDGHPQLFAPGEREKYCNGGYVVLALLAERAAGQSFYDLVDEHICRPAGLTATAFLRSDSLPGTAAIGYLENGRTNVFNLPVRGSGDGGLYSTLDDVDRFWAFAAGRFDKLSGADAGVSFYSTPSFTVISNTTRGAWPVVRVLR